MDDKPEQSNLPAQIAEAVAGVPKALVPTCLKALDRLVGAAVDIPVAWLAQKKAQIDAQTAAYTLVEGAIASSAAVEAGADTATVTSAMSVLVRKAYRKHVNREAVAVAMLEDLRTTQEDQCTGSTAAPPPLDEDWLNVFERYAEDASTERMQNLWGRVLAGEIRKPGRFSARTLRFLSEFSQSEGLLFAEFSKSAFRDFAPLSLVKPAETDLRDLICLESSGLVQGASGSLTLTMTFNEKGKCGLQEGPLLIAMEGKPGDKIEFDTCALTPLGQELLTLLPGRDARAAATAVANAIKSPMIHSAMLCAVHEGDRLLPIEVLWEEEAKAEVPV